AVSIHRYRYQAQAFLGQGCQNNRRAARMQRKRTRLGASIHEFGQQSNIYDFSIIRQSARK
ncbi:MAG TPA: hypothetical protein PKM91_16260, partial [Cyclobacteriaceae bacterium]|nr:hypothetical protein [Cyclobacteriaceae bacterium]